MSAIGGALMVLGGAGVVMSRLLVLHRRGTLSWQREMPLIVALPFAVLAVVAVARFDDDLARTDPLVAGALGAVVLGSLGTYATWLGHRYDVVTQRVLGAVSLTLAAAAVGVTLIGALARVLPAGSA